MYIELTKKTVIFVSENSLIEQKFSHHKFESVIVKILHDCTNKQFYYFNKTYCLIALKSAELKKSQFGRGCFNRISSVITFVTGLDFDSNENLGAVVEIYVNSKRT